MKKVRMLAFALAISVLLSGCCLFHEWEEATCEDPKHCVKCGEREGSRLGHEWMDATCEDPKTCERCGEIKGEPLGHTYTAWELSGDDMVRQCTVCSESFSEPADRELFGRQFILGKWDAVAMMDYDVGEWDFFDPTIFWVDFREDGTAEIYMFSSEVGTLEFDEYDAEEDEYRFTLMMSDGSSYSFDYAVEGDTLFTFGSGMALAWERTEAE